MRYQAGSIRKLKNSLRGRLLSVTLLSIILLGMVGLYSQLSTWFFLQSIVHVFERNRVVLEIEANLQSITSHLEDYLSTKSSEALRSYWDKSIAIRQLLGTVDRTPRQDLVSLRRKNVVFLAEALLTQAEIAIEAKRGRDVKRYLAAYGRVEVVGAYITQTINELNQRDFRDSTATVQDFSGQLGVLQVMNLSMILALMAFGTMFGLWFSRRITSPLDTLTLAAQQITNGDFSNPIKAQGKDEFALLSQAFELMRQSIVRSIQELNELMEERVNHLHMKSLLKHAELQALQAQINPHFLFNTLNAGIQLAIIEDANQTRLYMENLSAMLRHNIRQLDRPVNLSQELASLENYLYILRIRFGDRYQFTLSVQDNYPDIKMPAMILQPLVENAFIHGLAEQDTGGRIDISLNWSEEELLLVVKDNGRGMSSEKISAILDGSVDDSTSQPQSSGIGLGNVISRMRLFFENRAIITIQSELGQNSTISFRIFYKESTGDDQGFGG